MADEKKNELDRTPLYELMKVRSMSESVDDLNKKTERLVQQIVDEDDPSKIQDYTSLFNLSLVKKNAIRVSKLNDLLDKVNDNALQRISKHPEEISTQELFNYMNVVSTTLEKSTKSLQGVDTTNMLQINKSDTTNNITVNLGNNDASVTLDRESRDKIVDAVKQLINLMDKDSSNIIIDTTKDDTKKENDTNDTTK